jgi:hypothetical protein
MTYNFDPDRWLDNELWALESDFNAGRLNRAAYEEKKDKLMRRYDDMVSRLDGTYQIPDQ